MDSYRQFQSVRFFSCLDGLRGLSILAVIWHHTVSPALPASWPLVHEGNRGVDLFFAISAFLISTLLLRGKRQSTLNVPRFWARRALRIFPLYFLVLAAYVALVFFFERDTGTRQAFFGNLKYFATFTSNWFVALDSPRVIFYFAWSLAAEEQFYLCWPWIERYLPRWSAVVAVVALVITQYVGFVWADRLNDHLAIKVLARVPAAILLGVILAHLLNSPRAFARLFALVGQHGSCAVTAALTLLALGLEPRLGFAGELVVAATMTLLVAACVVREDNGLASFLRLRLLSWIGTISYGIYLLHMLSVHAFHAVVAAYLHVSSPWLDFVGGTAISLIVASLSYRTYESYFLRLKARRFGENVSPVKQDQPCAAVSTAALAAGGVYPPGS